MTRITSGSITANKTPISALWAEEKQKLLTLPEYEYEVFRYESLSVNKTGFVTIDTNRYGLPPTLAGKVVQAKIFFDRVEVYYDRQCLSSYVRSYGRQQEVIPIQNIKYSIEGDLVVKWKHKGGRKR